MKPNSLFLLLLVAVALTACLDEIEIDAAERPTDGYVIQAELVRGEPSYVEVKVEELFFFTSNINRPVSDARVVLRSREGWRYEFAGLPPLNGVYSAFLEQSTFPVMAGMEYRIEVKLSDDTELISDWEQLYEVPEADRLDWQFTEVEVIALDGTPNLVPGIEFGVTTPLRTGEEKARLRWEFFDAYQITDDDGKVCYLENDYQNSKVFLLDGNTVAPDSLSAYPLFRARLDIRHIEGYYLSAYQQALSPAAYAYWEEVGALLEREGTVFDNPAGAISSNFVDTNDSTRLIYGFFSAYAQDTVRRFLSREDTGELDFYCPLPPTQNSQNTICENCLIGLGASLSKPDYWE